MKFVVVFLFILKVSSSLVLDPSFGSNAVQSRQFYKDSKYWYGNTSHPKVIKYAIDDDFGPGQKEYIREQFDKLIANTCLKTLEYEFADTSCNASISCIRFFDVPEGTSCNSDLSKRRIELPPHCFKDKWVLHEILHQLGFGHEHARPDRNCYVEVTGPGLTDPEYFIQKFVDISFPYDVHSVMHYRTGERLRPASFAYLQNQEFGSWDELTEMDTIALNYMFCGGKHYCEINPERCQYFRCWIECNPCSEEPISQCKDCTGNTY